MRRITALILALATTAALDGCANGGIFHTYGPDEFAVQRQAPLVIPPDFALMPPTAGAPQAPARNSQQDTLDAMFGGSAPRSAVEKGALNNAGAPAPSIRSTAGDPDTHTADKGPVTRDILSAPQGDGREARAQVPG
jgi:hypothetical protein